MESEDDFPPFPSGKRVSLSEPDQYKQKQNPFGAANYEADDNDEYNAENAQKIPMMHSVNGDYSGTGRNGVSYTTGEKSSGGLVKMQNNRISEVQPAPTGTMAWVGFGCCVFALACLCVSFASPYWLQTWPMSENAFLNIGLWHVCFYNYMQFRDDSQQIYSGCWWLFDSAPMYYKLRQWLIPPWFISCQVLVVGCLVVEIGTALVTAMIFLHCCPMINHEYLQTYGIFASASMMFLVSMVCFVVAVLFGVQCNDRFWLPRPDQNFLSWGFGFLVISGIMALASGVCLFMEAQKTYNALLKKEDEYTKAVLEASAYPLDPVSSYPPGYDSGAEYGPGSYVPDQYQPTAGTYAQPTYDLPSKYVPQESYSAKYAAPESMSFGSHPSASFDEKPETRPEMLPTTTTTMTSFEPPRQTFERPSYERQRSFDSYNEQGPGFV